MSTITYNFENGHMSHFAVKKVDTDCHVNPERSTDVGVFCRECPHFHGFYKGNFIICTHPDSKNSGKDADKVHSELYEEIRKRAFTHLYE